MEELIKSEFDLNAYEDNAQDFSKVRNILQHLKYNYPAKAKPNEKAKPLSSDMLLQNKVFWWMGHDDDDDNDGWFMMMMKMMIMMMMMMDDNDDGLWSWCWCSADCYH